MITKTVVCDTCLKTIDDPESMYLSAMVVDEKFGVIYQHVDAIPDKARTFCSSDCFLKAVPEMIEKIRAAAKKGNPVARMFGALLAKIRDDESDLDHS